MYITNDLVENRNENDDVEESDEDMTVEVQWNYLYLCFVQCIT